MPEVLEKICELLGLSRKRQCTWSATEQAGEDAGECGVLERSEGGGRGHSGEESAPVAAMDVQHWRGERWAWLRRDTIHTQGVNGFPAAGGFGPLVSPLLMMFKLLVS